MTSGIVDDATVLHDVAQVEHAVQDCLRNQDPGPLRVLGYGEVTLVIGASLGGRDNACKRLPRFGSDAARAAYSDLLEEYLLLLRTTMRVAPTELATVGTGAGAATYCLQPALPAERLLPAMLAAHDTAYADRMLSRLTEIVHATVDDRLGLDAQVSNWADVDGEPVYLDVTTPMLRDHRGRHRLDLGLFCASLPLPLRPAARSVIVPQILTTYFRPRDVLLDLVANLVKEGLDALVPRACAIVSAGLDEPVTPEQARAYYAQDARTWAAIQALRRADRFVTGRVLRRTYPFLLPGPIGR